MKCPDVRCGAEMEHRTGKYGGFWYCSEHGTISDRAALVLEKIKDSLPSSLGAIHTYNSNPDNDPVMMQIHRQTLELGVRPTDIEEWLIDDQDESDYDDDHWMNIRPY